MLDKIRIKKINDAIDNKISEQFIEHGGNWRLKNFMNTNYIKNIDIDDEKIQTY